MRRCEKCDVAVAGDPAHCPLCQGDLAGTPERENVFPIIEPISKQYKTLIRFAIFVSIVAVAVCVVINYVFYFERWWALFVAAGLLSLWLSFGLVIRRRENIPKNILSQVALISALAVVWDFFTGFRLWSLDFVVPILCTCALLALFIAARILKLQIQDYIIYLILNSVLGCIPLLFMLLNILHTELPSAICVAASAVSLSALLVFEGNALWTELRRRMHL